MNSPARAPVSGTVVLQDAWGNVFDDFSGVDVTVDGVTTHGTADKAGAWQIDGVPVGNHDIVFTKATFGTMRVPGQSVATPATTVSNVTLAQAPWQQAVIDSIYGVTQGGRDYYVVDGHLSAPPPTNARFGATIAVVGKTNAVSSDVASFSIWGNGFDRTGKSSTFSIVIDGNTARSTFGAGTPVFVAAFTLSAACGCYVDPHTSRPVLPTAGPRSNVVPLTIK